MCLLRDSGCNNREKVMEISKFAFAPLLLMLFSVWAVVGGRPENTIMLFWIKKKQDHFLYLLPCNSALRLRPTVCVHLGVFNIGT